MSGDTAARTADALAEPAVPVRRGYIGAVALANIGIYVAFFTPIQALLPRLAEELSPGGKETALAWITGAGALAAIVANPLAGALSDRTTVRWGRRVPWVLGGAIAGAAALVGLGAAGTVVAAALVWVVAQTAINASFAGLSATVPDQVPVRQRGLVSGWIGLGQTVGIVLGVALVSFVVTDLRPGLVLTGVLLVVLVLPFALRGRDPRVIRAQLPELHLRSWLRGFWVSPRQYPDYGWAWLTRFLMMLGNAMATLYLLFWLQDAVHYPDPDEGQTVLVALYAVGTIITAVFAGRISDRSGRRKVYVIASTVVMAVAATILAFFPVFPAAMAAALLLGFGFGIYLAVDQALVTQVLPRAADRGRDLGLINIANSAPQVLAPVIAAPIVTSAAGYPGLYLLTAAVTLLSAVLVTRIRSVP